MTAQTSASAGVEGEPLVWFAPARLSHLLKAIFWGGPTCFLGACGWAISDLPEPVEWWVRAGWLLPLIGLTWLCFCAVARNLRALLVRPEFLLTPQGFGLRIWHGIWLRGIFLPWYRMRTYVVPWQDYLDCTHYEASLTLVTIEEELRLHTKSRGVILVGRDLFAPSLRHVQRTLLDYLDRRYLAPWREACRLAEFQSLRWALPLLLASRPIALWWVALPWLIAIGAAVYWWIGTQAAWVAYLAYGACVVGGVLIWEWWRAMQTRHLALTGRGVQVGRTATKSRVLPWDQIQFVRAGLTHLGYIEAIEVRLIDGSSVRISGRSQTELARLHNLLEPALQRLPDVWAHIDLGLTPEAAAQRAGLRGRAD